MIEQHYTWKGYIDYYKQTKLLEKKLQKLPSEQKLRIWRVSNQIFPAYYRKYLQKSDISILVSMLIFYTIFTPIVTLKFTATAIPIIVAVIFVLLLICSFSIKLIPHAYYPLLLETKARMIENIEAFEKAELTSEPLIPLKKLIFKYIVQIFFGLVFAGMLFMLQRMFCLVLIK